MPPVDGIWGTPTSTIDWCEENYHVTPLIAEFLLPVTTGSYTGSNRTWTTYLPTMFCLSSKFGNTISNVIFIVPSLLMLGIGTIEGHEERFQWCHFSVFTVGFGSWCFHMTLLYSMQLLDELPMIYGAAFHLYSDIEVTSPLNHKNRPLQIGLAIYCAIVTAFYLLSKHVIFFQVSYGLLVTLMVFSSVRLMLYYEHNTLLYLTGLVTYMSGFVLWNLDQHFCGHLQLIRKEYLGVFAPIFQLHAWWHILAGTGTYLSVLFSAHTRYLYLGMKPEIKFWMKVWPYLRLRKQKKE
nr:alkaline ceramidase 3 isoform X2 [Crassostrea gigas]